jgi:hypothetical protein
MGFDRMANYTIDENGSQFVTPKLQSRAAPLSAGA